MGFDFGGAGDFRLFFALTEIAVNIHSASATLDFIFTLGPGTNKPPWAQRFRPFIPIRKSYQSGVGRGKNFEECQKRPYFNLTALRREAQEQGAVVPGK